MCFSFYPGHNSWPMLNLFILWICEAQKKKKNEFGGMASPSYLSWYLTRKVFHLEKLNLFEVRNLKGSFSFLNPILFPFLSCNMPPQISLLGEPVCVLVRAGRVHLCLTRVNVLPDDILCPSRLGSPLL